MRSNFSTRCWIVGTEGMKWYFVKMVQLKCGYSPMFKKKHLVLYNRGSEYQSVTPPKIITSAEDLRCQRKT